MASRLGLVFFVFAATLISVALLNHAYDHWCTCFEQCLTASAAQRLFAFEHFMPRTITGILIAASPFLVIMAASLLARTEVLGMVWLSGLIILGYAVFFQFDPGAFHQCDAGGVGANSIQLMNAAWQSLAFLSLVWPSRELRR